jgi:hypothetical protein
MTHAAMRLALSGLACFALVACDVARVPVLSKSGPPASAVLPRAEMLQHLRYLSDDQRQGRGPGTPGYEEARSYIAQKFSAFGLVPLVPPPSEVTEATYSPLQQYGVPFSYTARDKKESKGLNLIGLVRGTTHPDEFLLVSAHYDHLGVRNGNIYNGADDNASGVAALLGLAEYFSQHPLRYTLVFVAFDLEEKGLRGSQALVEQPVLPWERLKVVLNLDMISRPDVPVLYVVGTSVFPQLRPSVELAAARASLSVAVGHDRSLFRGRLRSGANWLYASDHGPFLLKNFPALYLGVEDHPDYHQPTDDFDKIDPDFFVAAAEFAGLLLQSLDAETAPSSSSAPASSVSAVSR